MQFSRKSDGRVVDAKVWQRHGDHPKVRPATSSDPSGLTDPSRVGWIDGSGIVLPGDWIVTDCEDGSVSVVTERALRRDHNPTTPNVSP